MAPQEKQLPSEKRNDPDDGPQLDQDDAFPELPVRFRTLGELAIKTSDLLLTKDDASTVMPFTKQEIQERDLRHAEELKMHAQELENLYNLLEETTRKHSEEILSMERSFRDESQKREDLLEQALSYAEKLEASSVSSLEHRNLEIDRLQSELRKRDATIQKLRAEILEKDKDILKLKDQMPRNFNSSWWRANLKVGPLKRNSKTKAEI